MKIKSRDRGIWTDALLVQNRALYRWPQTRKCRDYSPSPGGQLWKIVARRVWLRRQFFRRGSRGLLCGWDLARSRGLGGSGGARDSQLFLGYVITGMFSEIHLNMTISTTTEEHYIIRLKKRQLWDRGFRLKLGGILWSRVLRVLCDLMKDVSPYWGEQNLIAVELKWVYSYKYEVLYVAMDMYDIIL